MVEPNITLPDRKSWHGPEVQEAVCRGDRPHGARGPEVRGRGQVFSQELREEFGHYTGLHGVEATVQVYSVHSDRLLFSVRPSTVRKFRSLYGEPGTDTRAYHQGLHPALRVQLHHNYLLHSSLDVLNQHP